MSTPPAPAKTPLLRRPWFAFLSSMRFAVALLSLLALASVIGTVLQQNQSEVAYLVEFGPFWHQIFRFLGLYDVYSAPWFVVIMAFLILSTGLCLWRNIPPFLREMRGFRLNASERSLAAMKHSTLLAEIPQPEITERYLKVSGFAVRREQRADGSLIIAAKKGSINKWGYICAHAAIIVICLGGLIDSNLPLKLAIFSGSLKPDKTAQFANDFGAQSRLGSGTLSFRGNVNIREGQTIQETFLDTGNGLLVQELPFSVTLKQFHVDYYDSGMPKNFASDLIVTDKQSGDTYTPTLRVNHPFTLHGITLYQASFGDGGSGLSFRAWNLGSPSADATELKAASLSAFPLRLGQNQPDKQYTLEFAELRPLNVENEEEADSSSAPQQPGSLQQRLSDARSVQQASALRNVGPTITFRLRDQAGQAHEYVNYMLPLRRGSDYYFATGERNSNTEPYRWLMIPADKQGKPDTFMHLRAVLLDPQQRQAVLDRAVADMPEASKARFRDALNNILELFAREGLTGINQFVQTQIPAAERDRMRELFYQMLFGAGNIALDQALTEQGLDWPQGEERNRFLINSFDAYTGLTRFGSPVLLQLNGFNEVKSSGLQMTRSPGQGWVYLGSALLILGTFLMFYIREQRAWLLYHNGSVRFAMSAARHKRQLEQAFSQHTQHLTRLAQELNHDQP
ncbi:cytochrome c biogenesis protein ResB [Eikenella sp. S3360]|uniref:Cytochrome c biogenesis protein ResB n=1 Tax=Eikenella glucosivorans TaxID=2766967 RepID=A0ABS0N871_9NEIS|nr:cytochrome c biogenesis protein ResB [Eikenella glucosivorans]MBH5328503.1 cytochrome c biogenesis protein ResB [Eikenella glucosivorans]